MTVTRAPDVAVIVESVGAHDIFPMTRCNYLSIESDEPRSGWELGLGGDRIPFLMLGLAGIIRRPFEAERFETPQQIEELFKRIEDEAGLLIAIGDIWLPNVLFAPLPTTGAVYRLHDALFTEAFLYREGFADLESFESELDGLSDAIAFSEKETKAFAAWHEQQLRAAIEKYPKSETFKLKWHEES